MRLGSTRWGRDGESISTQLISTKTCSRIAIPMKPKPGRKISHEQSRLGRTNLSDSAGIVARVVRAAVQPGPSLSKTLHKMRTSAVQLWIFLG